MVDMKVSRTVKIGVTGTSKIKKEIEIGERVRDVLFEIDKKLSDTPYNFVVISPLAEGADRILAHEIMNFKGSPNHSKTFLKVILQEKSENEESTSFNELIEVSKSTRTLDEILKGDLYRTIAEDYTHAGELVVDECDLLIALWDEVQSKKGDTARIVEYARADMKLPIIIINPNDASTLKENFDVFLDDLEYHNTYNTEKVNLKELQGEINENTQVLRKLELGADEKGLIKDNIITQLSRSNLLAEHYQKWHYRSANFVYYFSAATVFTVAFQLLFLPWLPELILVEVLLLLVIVVLHQLNKSKDWHRKWIDYRYLAERLRAATIFSIAGLDCRISEHLPHQSSGDDWTLKAYQSIHQEQMENHCPELSFEEKRDIILREWIRDQKDYYKTKAQEHKKRDKLFNKTIVSLFIIAALCALIHVVEVFWHLPETLTFLPKIITLLAIVLPVTAASLAGIRVQHEYLRISKRYGQMAAYLAGVEHRINKIDDADEKKLVKILDEANTMMLREHQDWRVIFSVREVELP